MAVGEMVDATLLSYVGAITGIAGLVLGYLGYRRSHQIKSLDLRLELRKAESDLRSEVQELSGLLQRARESRTAVNAARGIARTGAFESWKAAWEADMATAEALMAELPDANDGHQRTKHRDLESKLVTVHTLSSRATRLRDKYLAELAADDKQRDHIGEDMRVRLQANLGDKRG